MPKKLNKLEIDGADRDTPLRIDGAFGGQTAVAADAKALEGVPMIEHYGGKVQRCELDLENFLGL